MTLAIILIVLLNSILILHFYTNWLHNNNLKAWWMRNVTHRNDKFKIFFGRSKEPFRLFDVIVTDLKKESYIHIGKNWFIPEIKKPSK